MNLRESLCEWALEDERARPRSNALEVFRDVRKRLIRVPLDEDGHLCRRPAQLLHDPPAHPHHVRRVELGVDNPDMPLGLLPRVVERAALALALSVPELLRQRNVLLLSLIHI